MKKKDEYYNINFKKLKNLFFNANKFIKNIINEDYIKSVRFFVFTYIFLFTIIFIINLIGKIGLSNSILGFIQGIISSVIFFTLFVLFAHLGVTIVRGKNGIKNTIKPVAYALVILGIYKVLFYVILFIFPVDNSILNNLTTINFGAIKPYLMQPGVLISTLITLIGFLHTTIFASKGISKTQKISLGKSVFSVLFGWIILWIVNIIVIYLLLTVA